jgi:GMP synthase (glutamine-hydrolysing)
LGSFGKAAGEAGFQVLYRDAGVDDLEIESDVLVIMGGPIGAYEEDKYPFLTAELNLIERRLRAGTPVLGVCLGAQLMARTLGARVYAGHGKEIGWGPVTLTEAGRNSTLSSLEDTPILHWHGDTFDIPDGATLLASTRTYAHQAFSWGPRALALQFHAEVEADRIEHWLIGHACELSNAGADLSELRRGAIQWGSELAVRGRQLFHQWLRKSLNTVS